MRSYRHRTLIWGCILLAATLSTHICAQTVVDERVLLNDPDQLLEISREGGKAVLVTSIADLESRHVRESPANVTIITARQIQAAGARTLYEALQMVPGLSFGRDADDVIGVGIHGNWAEEGKCLFMLNGSQLNENDFGTYAIGDRIPISNVDRIEVIMGPGTVIHGSYAALGVVNIVTRNADQGTGARANVQTGFSENDFTRTTATVSGSHRLDRDREISYMTSYTRGRRSNALRLLPDSTLLNFADSTAVQASTFLFNYRWKNFKASMTYLEETFRVSYAAYSVQFRDVIFGLGCKKRLSQKLDLTWSVNHADQLPWYYVNTGEPDRLGRNTNNRRTSATGSFGFKPAKWFSSRIGIMGYTQRSTFYERSENSTFRKNDERAIGMNDGAAFAEVAVFGKPGMLIAGCRLEANNLAGEFFAPRFAYTKSIGNLHVKALWGRGFRTPTIMNLNYGPDNRTLSVEYVTTTEGEIGYSIGKTATLTANGYQTRSTDPIVHTYSDSTGGNYMNGNAVGTHGLDLRLSWETKRTTVLASYGFNQPLNAMAPPEAELPDSSSNSVTGLPEQRGSLVIAFDVNPSFTLRANANYRGEVWSHRAAGSLNNEPSLFAWPAELIINAGLTWRPKASMRLAVDIGCRNITDTQRTILGPVRTDTTPFALSGREYTLGITYKFIQ
ncbi:MAG: TonB-dependent receptor plug domain-containing protein [Flavobacteriales bacterium]|nr:TonB-dependent receptor plug domain-containing protein [Flavobacteriales bacterium]